MIRTITHFAILLLMASAPLIAQTAADCATDPSPTSFVNLPAVIANDQNYVDGVAETYCVSTVTNPAFTGSLGTVSLSSVVSPYPFSITITDLSDNSTSTLSATGDSYQINGDRRYFIQIDPTEPGAADVLLTPSVAVAIATGAMPQTTTITVDQNLPVTWVSPLVAIPAGKTNRFAWTVSDERDVADYILEAGDGVTFTAVTRIPSVTAAAAHTYEATDRARSAATYYRVRQTDLDGTMDYSNVILVAANRSVDDLVLAPNPAHGAVQILTPEAPASVQLLNAAGRSLPLAGRLSGETLNLNGLPAGLYLVRTTDATGARSTRRLIVR